MELGDPDIIRLYFSQTLLNSSKIMMECNDIRIQLITFKQLMTLQMKLDYGLQTSQGQMNILADACR